LEIGGPWDYALFVRRFRFGLLGLLLALGCAPTYHRAAPYRFDAQAASELQNRASDWCREKGEPVGRPSEPFRTDGCSMWPDGMFTGVTWQECCVEHDLAYWCGGTRQMRVEADRELQRCVAEQYGGWMGAVMRPGVLVGGHPWVPAYWRWGYGHRYPAPYYGLDEPLPPDATPESPKHAQ